MKNSEFIKLIENKMKGKLLKATMYTLVFFITINLICFLLNLIPIVGGIISIILIVPMSFGFEKMIILFSNGEKIRIFDFLKHAFKNFVKVWYTGVLLILKFLLPIVLLISGGILLNLPNLSLLGTIILLIDIGTFIAFYLRYTLINYEMAYNPEKKPKELLVDAKNNIKGHLKRYIYINLYYTAIVFLETFLLTVVVLIVSAHIVSSPTFYTLVGKIGVQIITLAIYIPTISVKPLIIAGINEFYKEITNK